MGDARFEQAYEHVRRAPSLAAIEDEEIVAALGAASKHAEPLLANVLTTEALNRIGRLRAALAHLGLGVIAADPQGRTTWANPAAEGLLGWARADLVQKEFCATVQHLDAAKRVVPREACAILAATRAGRLTRSGEFFQRKDGTLVCIEYTAAPILADEGEPAGVVIVFEDISDRIRHERELEEARERYRCLFDRSPQPGVSLDIDGIILDSNRAMTGLTQRPPERARGHPFYAFIHPGDVDRIRGLFERVVGGVELEAEMRVLHADGHYFTARARGIPIWVKDRVVGIHGVVVDPA